MLSLTSPKEFLENEGFENESYYGMRHFQNIVVELLDSDKNILSEGKGRNDANFLKVTVKNSKFETKEKDHLRCLELQK